jgi:hypothetical protein
MDCFVQYCGYPSVPNRSGLISQANRKLVRWKGSVSIQTGGYRVMFASAPDSISEKQFDSEPWCCLGLTRVQQCCRKVTVVVSALGSLRGPGKFCGIHVVLGGALE